MLTLTLPVKNVRAQHVPSVCAQEMQSRRVEADVVRRIGHHLGGQRRVCLQEDGLAAALHAERGAAATGRRAGPARLMHQAA